MSRAKLGIIGGMGPQATQLFYQYVINRTDALVDQDHIPVVIVSDTEMPDRTLALQENRFDDVFDKLLADAKLLEQCGCTVLAIPCNTSHYFVRRLQSRLSVQVVNMVRETAFALSKLHKKRPAILATDGVVRSDLYKIACREVGIEAIYPDAETQRLVMSIIYDEIKRGEKGSRSTFSKIDSAVRDLGCDCAVLACTELSVFSVNHHLSSFYVDAMMVLAEKVVTACGYPLRVI